jgi:hypothetical protein
VDKRKTNGTFTEDNQFGAGHGRPRIPQDIRDARKLNRTEVERVINEMLSWSIEKLKEFCKDEQNTVFECLVASILAKAIHQGDQQRLDFVLTVLNLKPKDGGGDQPNIHGQVVNLIKQIESNKNGNGSSK